MELPEDASIEEMRKAVESQKKDKADRELELEKMTLRNEYEAGLLKQQQWDTAVTQLKEAKEKMLQEHHESMKLIKDMTDKSSVAHSSEIHEWL